MLRDDLRNAPERAWAAYEPTADVPWDRAAVAHLHRRAGFAAPWGVLERDVKDGPGASVDRLLAGEPADADGRPAAAFDAEFDRMAARFAAGGNLGRLQAVWLLRMVQTPHPLRERMTLFWHDHFATSQSKVNNLALMRRQNGLLRSHALGSFPTLLAAMARDPAMLVWLDSATNRKAHPNENFAREVMELFCLGRGHYAEADIREAARAFTGSFVQSDAYRFVAGQHDEGPKTILGKTGHFGPDDVAPILLAQPACAEYLCGKLYRHLVSEVDEPTPALLAPLAEAMRRADYDVAAPVGMILRSRLFFDASSRRRRVKSPVELVVGTVRALEIARPTVSADAMAEATARMGQALFAPPSVAGWDGGPSWINTTTTLARSNFALALLSDDDRLGRRLDPEALASRHGRSGDASGFLVDLLLQDGLDPAVRGRLTGPAKEAAGLILSAPEHQLA